ncbi:hypothetical protein S83_068305, partial [Arachis hypogaea]
NFITLKWKVHRRDNRIQSHHELKISKVFVKEYWRGVSNSIVLKLQNNVEQRVHWIQKNEDKVWLEQGWKQIVEDFGLKHSQFLTFDYKRR